VLLGEEKKGRRKEGGKKEERKMPGILTCYLRLCVLRSGTQPHFTIMTFKGTPPAEATSPQAPHVPSELEIATKWDNCVETTIKSVAIGVAVTLPIFFFASMLF
jgi:hypothetical protein